MVYATDTPTLGLGLDEFELEAATEHEGELVLLVETTADRGWCRARGLRAASTGRARTLFRDVPMADRPVVLVWKECIWRCEQLECPRGSSRESCDELVSRRLLSERARTWAVRRVGRDGVALSQVVTIWGWACTRRTTPWSSSSQPMLADYHRLAGVRAPSVDEYNILRDTFNNPPGKAPPLWFTKMVAQRLGVGQISS